MKVFLGIVTSIGLIGSAAHAYPAFDAVKYQTALKNGDKTLLHFHADWCPTCRKQEKVLNALEADPVLKGVVLLKVDFDKEEQQKRDLKVNAQSTLIAFYRGQETGRITGKTSETDIKEFLRASFSEKTLSDTLNEIKQGASEKIPKEAQAVMEKAINDLRQKKLDKTAPRVGQKASDFALKDLHGRKVRLSELLKRGPVVLTFYRGGWCPYCNAQLKKYQEKLSNFKQLGAQLVAVSPETPDNGLTTQEKNGIKFEILSDPGNLVAKQYGLVYGITEDLKKIYQGFGIDLQKSQGNSDWQLPVPATFLIGKDRTIHYTFFDVDYRDRAEPDAILEAVKTKELKARLTPEEYSVAVEGGTEAPFKNKYWDNHRKGIYVDIISGEPLFSSEDKFDSGTGWPSFTKPIEIQGVESKSDTSHGMVRTEVKSTSGAHLGHVFNDGPKDKGGQRYCINSASLKFVPVEELLAQGYGEYARLFKK